MCVIVPRFCPDPMELKIAASIVTYNTDKDELARCIASLLHDRVGRIYICDNSPGDSLREICGLSEKLRYMHNPANPGYGSAHNAAIRASLREGYAYHLVINSDVYFEPGVMPELASVMEKDREVVQITPNVVYPDGRTQYACRLLPTPADLIMRRFFPFLLPKKRKSRYLLEFFNRKRCADVPYHMGCFMFFRSSAFEKAGMFDERFFMYPEDIDITRRMHRIGKTLFWPGATIVHAHRAESYRSIRMLCIHSVNMIRYFNKWGWSRDGERKEFNRRVLSELGYEARQNAPHAS